MSSGGINIVAARLLEGEGGSINLIRDQQIQFKEEQSLE